MNKTVKKIIINLAYPVGVTAALLALWAIVAAAVNNYFIVPNLAETFGALAAAFKSGAFWSGLGGTLLRTLIAFAVSLCLGFCCAILSLLFVPARRILSPIIAVCRALPTLVIVLILAVWLSPQIVPSIVAVFVGFPLLYSGFLAAFDGVDRGLIEMSRVYDVSRRDMVARLWVPSVLPVVLPVVGSTLSLLVKLMVAAEIMASTAASLGSLIAGANAFFDMGGVFALTFTAVILAVALEFLTAMMTRLVTRKQR